jgi:multidrug resistance efflux pump
VSIPFTQTTRSLATDTARNRVVWLLVIALLLAVWLAWGFFSQITLYEITDQASLSGASTIVAQFSPAVQGRIQPGQMARLRLDSYPWLQYGTVAAVVTTVPRTPREGWLEVRLSIAQEPPAPIALDFGMTGVVEVAVEQVSPAELLLRTAGRRISR